MANWVYGRMGAFDVSVVPLAQDAIVILPGAAMEMRKATANTLSPISTSRRQHPILGRRNIRSMGRGQGQGCADFSL